jgi:uncharacterized RDD family membrane protein YckC
MYPYGMVPGGYGFGPSNTNLAPWGARIAATLLDGLIAVPLFVIGFVILLATFSHADYSDGYLVKAPEPTGPGVAGFLLCGLLALVLQLWQFYRQGTTGQTIGKKVVGIRVLKEANLQPTGFGMAFVRGLAHVLDGLPCYIGYFAPLWDEKNRTFADMVCGTVVLQS